MSRRDQGSKGYEKSKDEIESASKMANPKQSKAKKLRLYQITCVHNKDMLQSKKEPTGHSTVWVH